MVSKQEKKMDCKFYEKIEYDMPEDLSPNDPSTSTLGVADGNTQFGQCVPDTGLIVSWSMWVVVGILLIGAVVMLSRLALKKRKK